MRDRLDRRFGERATWSVAVAIPDAPPVEAVGAGKVVAGPLLRWGAGLGLATVATAGLVCELDEDDAESRVETAGPESTGPSSSVATTKAADEDPTGERTTKAVWNERLTAVHAGLDAARKNARTAGTEAAPLPPLSEQEFEEQVLAWNAGYGDLLEQCLLDLEVSEHPTIRLRAKLVGDPQIGDSRGVDHAGEGKGGRSRGVGLLHGVDVRVLGPGPERALRDRGVLRRNVGQGRGGRPRRVVRDDHGGPRAARPRVRGRPRRSPDPARVVGLHRVLR